MRSDSASSIAATYNSPGANPAPLEAKQGHATKLPGQGAHAPRAAVPPPPPGETKTLDAKSVADRLINAAVDNAARNDKSNPMRPFYNLEDAYLRAGDRKNPEIRTDIQKAMLTNPTFKKIVDGAAKILIGDWLKEQNRRTDRTYSGDMAMHALYNEAQHCHPDVAAALVISAMPLFVQHSKDTNGAIFSFDDQPAMPAPGHSEREGDTYLAGLSRYVGSSNPQALAAIKQLETLVVTPSP